MNAAANTKTFGLLRVGRALIGVDVAALQEVFPCPSRLQALPASEAAVRGAVRLRDLVIPVLDLSQTLRLDGQAPASQMVVVVRHEGRLLGLLVDAVQGMATIAENDLHGLEVTAPAAPAAPAAAMAGRCSGAIVNQTADFEGEVVAIVDIARLASHDGIPWVRARDAKAGSSQSSEPTELLLLFRCGAFHMAIAAAAVASTAPHTEVHESVLGREPCIGLLRSQSLDVPVVDLPALLGLAPAAEPRPQSVAALLLKCNPNDPNQMVALTVDVVSDMSRVRRSQILPRPVVGLTKPGLFRGVIDWALDGGTSTSCLLLDDAALAADTFVQALASMTQATSASSTDGVRPGDAAQARSEPVLTFNIGQEMAVPLMHVSEIIPMRTRIVPTNPAGGPIVGLITHRGAVTALVDLAQALGHASPAHDEDSRVLLVRDGPDQIGFIVHRLGTVDECRWRTPGQENGGCFDLDAFRRRPPLIELGSAQGTHTLPLLDLASLCRGITQAA